MFDNADPDDRQSLIQTLKADQIPAYEYHSGGGFFHVAVTLLDDEASEDFLQIVTGNGITSCDIGMMGWKNGADWESNDWQNAATLQEARDAISALWAQRARLIATFIAGS